MPDEDYSDLGPLDLDRPQSDPHNNPGNIRKYALLILGMGAIAVAMLNLVTGPLSDNVAAVGVTMGGIAGLSLLASVSGQIRGKPYKLEHLFAHAFTYTVIVFSVFALVMIVIYSIILWP